MTDKIRIVGSFGEGTIDKVRELVDGLEGVQSVSVLRDGIETYPEADSVKGVQSVSVLRDGIETYPEADSVKAEQGTDGEQASEATAETAAPAEQTA